MGLLPGRPAKSLRPRLTPRSSRPRRTNQSDTQKSAHYPAAIERVDQCVAVGGLSSSVRRITSSTCSSEIRRGAPGRGSSSSPSSPSATNRRRHLPTVAACTPSSTATVSLLNPWAQRNTIRARNASAWAVFGRRAHRSSAARCSPDSNNSSFGRPRGRRAIVCIRRRYQHNLTKSRELMTQNTSSRLAPPPPGGGSPS